MQRHRAKDREKQMKTGKISSFERILDWAGLASYAGPHRSFAVPLVPT
jgi:hypothetical protein